MTSISELLLYLYVAHLRTPISHERPHTPQESLSCCHLGPSPCACAVPVSLPALASLAPQSFTSTRRLHLVAPIARPGCFQPDARPSALSLRSPSQTGAAPGALISAPLSTSTCTSTHMHMHATLTSTPHEWCPALPKRLPLRPPPSSSTKRCWGWGASRPRHHTSSGGGARGASGRPHSVTGPKRDLNHGGRGAAAASLRSSRRTFWQCRRVGGAAAARPTARATAGSGTTPAACRS